MDSFFRLACRFRKQESGATVTMFAFAGVVLIGMAGVVIDYGRLTKAHTTLQAATDAAALAAARLPSKDAAAMRTAANNFFVANTTNIDGTNVQITKFGFEESTGTVLVETSGVLDTSLMSIAGIRTMGFSSKSAAVKEVTGTVEMALVLDNTWSMSESAGGSDSKITVLKAAAKNLIETVLKEGGANVKIGIVPFADYVNVGTAYRGESWISVPADTSSTSTRTCKKHTTRNVCTKGAPATCTRTIDGVRENYDCTPQTCQIQTVPEYETCSGGGTTHNKWFGCVYTRNNGSNLLLPDQSTGTLYKGIQQTSQTCLNPIVPLTNNKSTLTSAIDGLIINRGSYKPATYIPDGMVWGVNVLSSEAPFSEGKVYDTANKLPRKALVLMTDGDNRRIFNNAKGDHSDLSNNAATRATQVTKVNNDTLRVCTEAKARKIEVFTVAFAVTDVAAKTMLQGCATDAAHYYDATDAAALAAAFQAIGQSLTSLRLSQ
ncbi:pilus assembly protein TadG-related protein [Bosea sp. AAP35]|uniref:pilus assembly protein TadG-related protein n=1 Tax=Bosea sp. AAP35 TaxID=1523417 RepID=UPI0006B9A5A2|nr:pilus assembly protein TadG-related protein [Bosea sp. AAP35]